MSNQTTPPVPGLKYPTQQGMLAGNPRDSAIASQNQTNMKQSSLSNAVGGKRNRRKGSKKGTRKGYKGKVGAGQVPPGQVAVPQFQMQYKPTGGPGQDPNAVIQQNSQTSTQSTANAVYDDYATKGGSSKYNWGCYSGGKGKRHTKRKTRKTRKTRKSRKA